MERNSFEQVTYVENDDVPYATFCNKTRTDSVRFFTAPIDDFQGGSMERPAGYQVKAHAHPRSSKVIDSVGEFLVLESGTIRVEVFDEEWMQLADEVLEAGDFVVLFRCRHSVTVRSTARFIEVKPGPFPEHGIAKLFRDPEILQIGSTEGE